MKKTVAQLYKKLTKKDMLFFDYGYEPQPRKPIAALLPIIQQEEATYSELLTDFAKHKEVFLAIKNSREDKHISEAEPFYNNGYLPGLDIIATYGMLAHFRPKNYFEIGSGNSTKVVRLAIKNEGLDTRITSLDPQPRAQIDDLADEVIRKGIEQYENFQFIADSLGEGDILFYDGTHIAAPNSDVTVFFMEVLPLLKKGVIVHIHDIFLPYDYPQFMCERYYSEQYILAAFIMTNPNKYKPLFPAYYVFEQTHLLKHLDVVLNTEKFNQIEKHGGGFWMVIND